MNFKKATLIMAAICMSVTALAQETKIVDEVIIKINDEIITRSEFENKMGVIEKQLRSRLSSEQVDAEMPKLRTRYFNLMVNQKILESVVNKRGWKMPEDYYQNMVDSLKQQTQSRNDQEFLKALQDNGMTLEDVREMAKRNFIDGTLFRYEVAKEIPDTESEIQEYYDENSAKYLIPAKMRISQIIFPFNEENKAEIAENAAQALARIKAGEDFDAVYRSVTPQSAPDATGDIGIVDVKSLRSEMKDAIDPLENNQVSEVIETPAALLIVKVTEKEDAKITPLEEIKDLVVNDMREKIMMDGLDKLLLKYKKEFYIELKSDEYAALYDPKYTKTR